MRRAFTSTLLTLTTLATFAACGGDGARGGNDTTTSIADSMPVATATGVAVLLSDENVFALLDTTYAAAAQFDSLAARTAQDTAVRRFAASARDANTLSRRAIVSTAERLSISPILPDDDGVENHAQHVSELRSRSGAEFDRLYLQRAAELRDEMIDEIDDALGANTRRDDVRTMLQQLRTTLESQRQQLQQLRSGRS